MCRADRILDALVLTAALVSGFVGWLLFGVFLWSGPLGLVDLGIATAPALVLDGLLSLAFFAQHSGMIRRRFRARLASLVPRRRVGAAYAVASGLVLAAVVVSWQPAGTTLFTLAGPARVAMRVLFILPLFGFAWAFFSLRGFDPFGATPIANHVRGRDPAPVPLVIRGPYRLVRHPMYTLTIVLLWAHPDMTADRLLFAALWTAWIVVGTRFEERDLARAFGDAYAAYQRRVPMLLPLRRAVNRS